MYVSNTYLMFSVDKMRFQMVFTGLSYKVCSLKELSFGFSLLHDKFETVFSRRFRRKCTTLTVVFSSVRRDLSTFCALCTSTMFLVLNFERIQSL